MRIFLDAFHGLDRCLDRGWRALVLALLGLAAGWWVYVPLHELLHAAAPRVAQIVMNTSFRMFPDSEAAKGEKGAKPQLSAEAVALQQMMRGIHF